VRRIALLAVVSRVVWAQAPAPRVLEAGDIHRVDSKADWVSVGLLPDGYVRFHNANLRKLIAVAYGVPDSAVTGGPAWADSDRFDIVARLAPMPRDSVRSRLQRVLAERFKLSLRHVASHDTVYALTVANGGPKFQRATTVGEPSCEAVPGVARQIHVGCRSYAMSDLATFLPRAAGGYITLSVEDRTGLEGAYDFQIDWMGRGPHDAAVARTAAGAPPDSLAVSIFEALSRLGLSLDKRDVASDGIVIESATRVPAAAERAKSGGAGLTATSPIR
jgi:uncharacterized protein (TIGR03435 family)